MVFDYITTDLDLVSPVDLAPLAAALEERGVWPHGNDRGHGDLWYSILSADDDFDEPEPNIAAMLAAIESLDESSQQAWWSCTKREFNIGFQCGSEPYGFHQSLSTNLLHRMAAVGASLRITLYPERPEPSSE